MTEQALACDREPPLSLVPLRPYSNAVPALIYCAFLASFLFCGNISTIWIETLSPSHEVAFKRQLGDYADSFFYVMQKSKLRLVAWLFSHEVHSMIRVWKSSNLEHWKTLREGWVNALDTLYDLFLILDNLPCMGESLNKDTTFSQLRKIESTAWFK